MQHEQLTLTDVWLGEPVPQRPTPELVRLWIKSKRISLWGTYFSTDERGLELASQWFCEQFDGYQQWIQKRTQGEDNV